MSLSRIPVDWNIGIDLLTNSPFYYYRKNTLENTDEWLKDEALDAALEEATGDCPDLLQLVSLDDTCREDLFAEYKALKESCREDEEYLQSLRHSIKVLK